MLPTGHHMRAPNLAAARVNLRSQGRGPKLGQGGHWVQSVAQTAIVWSAVIGTVGQRDGGAQRYRTGAVDRGQTSDLGLGTDHTKHRHSDSQSRQRSTRHLQSESHGTCTGCVPTLGAGAYGVTEGVPSFKVLSLHVGEV